MAGSVFGKIRNGLKKTRDGISGKIEGIVSAFKKIDGDFYEELEEALILSDTGALTARRIIDELKREVRERRITDADGVKPVLADIIARMLACDAREPDFPCVILVVGVNGVGKTTAIGKLAYLYASRGKSVTLAAADTFRAAAAEQLSKWGERAGAKVIRGGEGADPAAVVYDAIDSAKHRKTDVLICDTAGRLHNKKNLMNELSKINKVIDKSYPEADKRTYLVIDATTGQNALAQAREFGGFVDLSGIILTKIDGTAKGGIVIAVRGELNVPVAFLGVGEGIDDLEPFDARAFAYGLFE